MNTLQQEPGEGVNMKDKTQEDVWGRHPTEVEKHEHLLKKLEAMMDENPPENSIAGDILGDLATAISLYEDKCDALATATQQAVEDLLREKIIEAVKLNLLATDILGDVAGVLPKTHAKVMGLMAGLSSLAVDYKDRLALSQKGEDAG